jgi:hypothetical protein
MQPDRYRVRGRNAFDHYAIFEGDQPMIVIPEESAASFPRPGLATVLKTSWANASTITSTPKPDRRDRATRGREPKEGSDSLRHT